MSDANAPRKRSIVLVTVALFVVTVALRVVPALDTIEAGRVVVRDPDSAYHLRHAALLARHFPDLALFDRYVNHPHGAHVIWPPLYDLVLAGALTFFPTPGGSHPGAEGPSIPVALLPPLLLGGAVVIVFLMARALWPGHLWLAALAAAVPAIVPATLPYTSLGITDHHAAELLATALTVALVGGAFTRAEAGAPVWRAALRPAAALAAALLVQLSLVVLIGLIVAAAFLATIPHRWRALAVAGVTLALAALFTMPWAVAYAEGGVPFRHHHFGLFQPALTAAAALLCMLPVLLTGDRRRVLPAILAATALVPLLWILGGEIAGGLAYVTRRFAPWQGTIGESRALFADGFAAGIREAAIQLSALVFLVPVAWVHLARRIARSDPQRRTLFLATLLFAALGIQQQRFLPHLALFLGIGAGIALEPWLLRRRSRRERSWIPIPRPALATALTVAALIPCAAGYGRVQEPALAYDQARPVLEHLARHTPPTSHFDEPTLPAEYGVLAEWSFGHFIQYHGRRPAVADNFGDHAGDPLRVRDFFLSTDPARALALAESLGVRYVLVRDLAAGFQGLIPDDEHQRRFLHRLRVDRSGGGQATLEFTPAIESTVLYRLARSSGSGFPSGNHFVPALERLRLVAESTAVETIPGGGRVPSVKLYELVPGARLTLRGRAPEEEGVLLAAVQSPRGRRFPFVSPVHAGADGTIEVRVPYPTVPGAGESTLVEGQILFSPASGEAGTEERIPLPAIDAAAVQNGATIDIAWTSPS